MICPSCGQTLPPGFYVGNARDPIRCFDCGKVTLSNKAWLEKSHKARRKKTVRLAAAILTAFVVSMVIGYLVQEGYNP